MLAPAARRDRGGVLAGFVLPCHLVALPWAVMNSRFAVDSPPPPSSLAFCEVAAALHYSHLILGKKVQVRKPAPGASDAVPSRKRPTPVNLASAIKRGNSAISQRPFKDRVVHLLALKPYKKPELILRLQKDGLSQQDKDLLDNLLQQVCTLMKATRKKKFKNVFSAPPPPPVEAVISRLQLNVTLKAVGDTLLSSQCWCTDSRSLPWLRLRLGGCSQAGWFWLTRSVPFTGTLLLGHGEDSLNRGSANYLIITSKSLFYSHGYKAATLCIGTSFVSEGKDVPRFFVLLRAFPAWKCHWSGVKIMQLLAKHIICVSGVKAVSKLNQFLAL